MSGSYSHRFCVAPMMDCTDRHERFLLRLFSQKTFLYTEMVAADALLHGDSDRYLTHHVSEWPLGLQLGGADSDKLSECARLGEAAGFDEINLNVGCPSPRVQAGRFGACLMMEPRLVGKCLEAMHCAVGIPITVKCRTGIDQYDDDEFLHRFVDTVVEAGCSSVIVHARKAHLKGLSPKQNREIPPLRYDRVYRLKQAFPDVEIVINGGIRSLAEASLHLQSVDGVMVGREAYRNPHLLSDVDKKIFATHIDPSDRWQVLSDYKQYIAEQLERGVRLKDMSRHLLSFFHGQPGARAWRRHIGKHAVNPGAGLEVIDTAEQQLREALAHAA